MEPDVYIIKNPSRPTTALAAWMGMARIGRNQLASMTNLSEAAVSAAMGGGGKTRKSTATLLSSATGLDMEVIRAGDVRSEWTFDKKLDGTVSVVIEEGEP
jgi:hypothetical protein